MTLALALDPVPLVAAEDGQVIRVAGTRVNLETILGAFLEGSTPEQIAEDFPAVPLADVYAVIAYYLRHREEVEGYLAQSARQADQAERELTATLDHAALRARLLDRQRKAQAGSP